MTQLTIDTRTWDEDTQKAFVAAWEAAGGYMGDLDTSAPWCCPWYHGSAAITVTGDTPEEWSASYWQQCKPEIERALAAEAEAEAEAEG